MRKIIRLFCLTTVVSLMFACLGNPTGGSTNNSGTETIIYSYSLRGDSLTIVIPPQISLYCIGNTLTRDTFDIGSITLNVEVVADSLKIFDWDTTMLSSGAVVQYASVYCRSTGGSGIMGSWTPCSATYRVMAGSVLTSNDLAEIASEISQRTGSLSNEPGTMVISQSEITFTGGRNRAQDFVDDWNDFNAGNYDISVTVVNASIVELRGRASSEIVRITFSSNGDMVYTSNDSSHIVHRYYETPTQCPNDREPGWYQTFLDDNILSPGVFPLPKASTRHRTPRIF